MIPKGIPSSSVLAYLLPIDKPASSTLLDIPTLRSTFLIFLIYSLYFSAFITGKIDTLIGAILGGNVKNVLYSSLILKLCSKIHNIILPIPNAGSIT